MQPRANNRNRRAKRNLVFETPPHQKGASASLASFDKENSKENRIQPAVQPAAVKPNIDESFALNFSTFIDPKRGNPLDVTVSPTSFDLSSMQSSEDEDEINATNVTAGITATTFVLENKVQKVSEKEQLLDAKATAVKQREESEHQLKEVEEKVRRLREKIERKEDIPEETEHDVVLDSLQELMAAEGKGGMHIPALVRFASSPAIKHRDAESKPEVVKSANSTTDLKQLRSKKEGLNEEAKKARLQGLRAMTAPAAEAQSQPQSQLSATTSAPVHRPIDPTNVKARTKSRPQKLKMLRAVSTLDATDFTNTDTGFVMKSPSRMRGIENLQNAGKPVDAVFHKISWPGDEDEEEDVAQEAAKEPEPNVLFKKLAASATAPVTQEVESEDDQEDESCSDDILSPLCEEPPTPSEAKPAATASPVESMSESMDEDMQVDLTMMEQSVMHLEEAAAGSRYSIFAAPPATNPQVTKPLVNKRLNLLDVKFDEAGDVRSTHQSLEQLDYVTKDPKLAGLFGEHLKGMRCDSILRLLDDIQEFKTLMTEQERLSLARSIFQMYLSDSAAKENSIPKDVVDAETRAATRKQIRASQGSKDLFDEVEEAVRYHLALKEMPEFVKGDVYRTLGFKKPKKSQNKKVSVQNAFAPAVAAPVAKEEAKESALFKKAAAPSEDETVIMVAVPPQKQEKMAVVEEDDDDNVSDEEEESSDMSPVQKAAAPAPTKASAAATIVTRAKKQNMTPASAVVEEIVVSETPSSATPTSMHDTTIDSILENPEERETFLSFVKSTDKRAAQKANANVSFLVKVAQFNKANASERPTVARSIYDSYLATPVKKKAAGKPVARDQKGQVDVDVSELRKRQLVSRFRTMIENPEKAAASPALQKGFFDKAAKDVEAFVGPELNKFNMAKKNGTIEKQKKHSSFPFASDVLMTNSPVPAPANREAVASPKMPTSLPKDFTLTAAFEEGGNAFDAFVAFSKDIGRGAPAEFLAEVQSFKGVTDPVKRTPAAFYIMNTFLNREGTQPLAIPDHVRSGPQLRWDIFAKRNLIKADFFDSVVTEVVKMLEKDTWPRFVAQTSTTTRINRTEVSSFLSESSGIEEEGEAIAMLEEEPSNFDFGITLQRDEIEEEIKKRLREEQEVVEEDNDSDSDSGVEDSPDAPSTESRVGVMESEVGLGLDLSPSTAADLLNRLDFEGGAVGMDDTVMISSKKEAPRTAKEVFETNNEEGREQKIEPSSRPQTFIPVRRAVSEQTDLIAAQKRSMGIWPSRASKMMYGEGVECKKRIRYVVLKNKTLYVWSSEMDYKKSKEPKRVLDMDDLVQLNIVRDHSSVIGVTKWTLRIKFDGLGFAVILASDSQQTLSEWKKDMLESAPQLTV